MRVKNIDGYNAVCEAKGAERTVSLFLMMDDEVKVGDILMISMGNALQKMTQQEADQAWELYDEILRA